MIIGDIENSFKGQDQLDHSSFFQKKIDDDPKMEIFPMSGV